MTFSEILSLAIGLAMDATAVSAARGMAAPRILPRHVALVAVLFGGFQALMPLLGWGLGNRIGPLVESWDHWIAFVVLAGLGGKMLWESRSTGAEGTEAEEPRTLEALFGLRVMVLLAIATSIDALAVGFTLPILGAPLLLSIVTIGVTAAVASAAGLLLGRRFGGALGKHVDALGGLILIAFGVRILFEHLSAG